MEYQLFNEKQTTSFISCFSTVRIYNIKYYDVLTYEGEIFGRKLEAAGVYVITVRYNEMIHNFGLLNALANLPTTKAMVAQAASKLKK